MARPQTIPSNDLLDRIEAVFARVGYEGASLAMLAEAAGLRKASLYHRFPGGKAQMAADVLRAAQARLEAEVLAPLRAEGPPKQRAKAAAEALRRVHEDGRRASLLNMLAAPGTADGDLTPVVQAGFGAMIDAFAKLARDGGAKPRKARRKAERAVMLIEGGLVMARGTGDAAPFLEVLERLPDELL